MSFFLSLPRRSYYESLKVNSTSFWSSASVVLQTGHEKPCPATTFKGFQSQWKLLLLKPCHVTHSSTQAPYGSVKVSLVLLYFSSQFSPASSPRHTLFMLFLLPFASLLMSHLQKKLPNIAWHRTVPLDSDSVGQESRKTPPGGWSLFHTVYSHSMKPRGCIES